MKTRLLTLLTSVTMTTILTLAGIGKLQAQATDAQLVGTVFDPTGAAVPNATVELTNKATNVKSTTTTNGAGEYRFDNIPAGTYDLKTTSPGFNTSTQRGLQVALGKASTSNVTLAVGDVSTTIEVAETATLIDTTTAQVGTTFGAREAIDSPASALPMGTMNLALLGAGVSNPGGIGLGDGPSVGGQRPRNNSFTVEGVDNNRRDVTGHNVQVPSEAVSEFTVLQNQYSAEFGAGTGGQFITSIRGGSNSFHGSAFEYLQNRNFNAVDQSSARQGFLSNQRYDQNTFGGSIGGPIKRDKLFFYGLWQYNPTGTASSPSSNPVYSPTAAGYATLSGMPGISQTNLGVLKQYLAPAPTADQPAIKVNGTNIPIGTLPITAPSYLNIQTYLVSMDYNPSSKDQIRGRFVNEIHTGFDPSTLAPLPSFFVGRDTTSKLLSFSEIHNFSPTLLNEFRFGYSRYNDNLGDGGFTFPGLDSFPNLVIDDLNSTQLGPYSTSPQFTVINSYQLIDNLSWTAGRHTMKFGWEGRKYIDGTLFTQRLRGDYEYDTLENYLQDISPAFAERNVGGALYTGNAINQALFGTDQFRLRQNLTINVGLRWDYQGIPADDKQQALNAISSIPGVIDFREPKAQKTAFSPHLGIAYSPGKSGNTSIRAGFGLTYDKIFENQGTLSRPPQVSSTVDVDPGKPNFLKNGGIPATASGAAACTTVTTCRAITSAYIPDQMLPYALTWNFGVQHVFAKDYTLEVRYLGTRGVHLFVQQRLNRVAKVTPDVFLPTYLTAPSTATLAALPVTLADINARSSFSPLYPGFTSNLFALENWGNSSYNGLAVEFTRRFTRNLLFKAAYTWSHNIDDSTADLFSTYLSPRRPQDFQNWRNEKSNSFLDRRHRFTYNWVYDLPWYSKSDNKMLRYALGGYILSGTYTFESPQYATVQSNIDSNLNGDNAGDRVLVNPGGTSGVGSGVVGLTRTGARITAGSSVNSTTGPIVAYLALNPNAQYIVAGLGALANGGRQTLPLGRINNWDAQIKKAFRFGEVAKLEIAAQFFNVLNHPQYTAGYTNIIQFHNSNTTRDNLIPNNPAFNRPDLEYNSNSRTTQLTARIQF
ncbi:MAG: Cna domain protein [Bryobacterales bacterium]|nr:Cna domain protein [Bryobacterales bacterium]